MPFRPARGHGLEAGVEADALHAVHIVIAEQRALPAAEGMIGDRHRDRHIDADHADLRPGEEIARGVAVPGEDGRAVAVFVVVDHAERILVALRAHDREHRAEDLLGVDRHIGRHPVEQAAAEEKAVLIALQADIAPVDHQLGTGVDALADQPRRCVRGSGA